MNKKTSKLPILLSVLAATALAFWACQSLDTTNFNAPDTASALGTPEDVETLIRGSMLTWWGGAQNGSGIEHMETMADALTWSWGNYGSRAMSSEPRIAYPNRSDWRYRAAITLPWNDFYSALSAASDGLRQIDGGLEIIDATRTHRARAFAKFVQGLCLGSLACFYDQAFILDETIDLEKDVLELQPYDQVMDAAIATLEEAANLMETGTAFDLEEDWINGLTPSNVELAQITHSYIARFLAQVARTPAERAAVDWGKVRSHAERGITETFAPVGDGTEDDWWHSVQWFHNDRGDTWGRVDYKHIGGSDESDGYQNWLNTPVASRQEFDMVTSDLRITGMTIPNFEGLDVDGGTYIGNFGPSPFRPARGTYHFSKYGYYRYEEHQLSGGSNPMPVFTVEENDLLIAEAMLRAGDTAGAAAIIDKTRVTNGGYPSAAGAPVGDPGDPRSPLPGSSLWAMLKYEKGIECLQTGFGLEYFDNRGWGDLVVNTPLHAPLPAEELEVLQLKLYTFGGGGDGSAPGNPQIPKVSPRRLRPH